MIHQKAVRLTDDVYWVGAIDWGVRNFHGYTTGSGTTYNAYLIVADKVTLVDTVKKGFEDELFARIASVIDPSKIDYIISNHSEPDHSGSIPEVVKVVSPEKVFASSMGVKALNEHFTGRGIEFTAVKSGDELSLGNMTLTFMETRMLHWPDSMFSYLVEKKILFSQDAFGMHLATSQRFDDELQWEFLEKQAADYYANIITLYSNHVARLFDTLRNSGLAFDIVAPDHGPVWRDMKRFGMLLDLYKKWSSRELSEKAVIVYDTMWKSTEKMARHIEEGLMAGGVRNVKVMPLSSCDRSHVASDMLDAAALIAGAPTLNNALFPSLSDALTYVRGLKFGTPLGAVFGSYGWSGESVKKLREYLESMDIDIVGEVKSKYIPDEKVRDDCFHLGETVALKIKNYISRKK